MIFDEEQERIRRRYEPPLCEEPTVSWAIVGAAVVLGIVAVVLGIVAVSSFIVIWTR